METNKLDLQKIPKGWEVLDFKEAVIKISTNKKKIKQKEYLERGAIPVIDQGQELIGGFTNDRKSAIDCELPVLVFGDHTKAIKLVTFPFAPGADGIKVIKPLSIFLPKLFASFVRVIVHKIPDKGYARHFQHLEKTNLPLPPLAEQHRIVDKIEELFSDLDDGIASLKKAQQQLKVYRQAVLKWAFEGKLTAQWREEQKRQGKLESAETLLEQIKADRERRYQEKLAQWQADVKAWEANGKAGKKPGKPKAYKVATLLLDNELAAIGNIPRDWQLTRIGDITLCLDNMRIPINKKDRSNREGSIPYYGANGQVGWIDDYLFDEPLVLVVEDETFVGREKPFSYRIKGKSWVNNHAHILRPENKLNIDFLNYQLQYYPFTPLTTGTTGRRKLTQAALIEASFKICSLAEQNKIVEEIESRLSICDSLETTITENLQQAEALRQSILKQAFEGKLVPQDPNDEPASVLLERIRQTRNKQGQLNLKNL
ncbi:restriction endonuclease subunit S [Limnothrix sp. FACHB-1083]|uniref:restriction endonuclease subunit S n=1 Tax=unclassified Limnothrix TaxID=2632864 RepID=UPI0016812FFC|nr:MULTISPECIES: restriction endonuclease subunit S [unclassified Limnothrix]MBD2162621.1 restriction endonuclease subunit S [Limnothrix sp. FACHB-1083]MBD2193726.1 restriction endonuclease subunit S [Limnothrix sp. FACHB-1088]